MAREVDCDQGQTTFGVILTHHTCTSKRAQLVLFVIRHVEVVERVRTLLETLQYISPLNYPQSGSSYLGAVERHILDGDECSVVLQDEIQQSVTKNHSICSFNHTWQDR